jgi:hypothetical protein
MGPLWFIHECPDFEREQWTLYAYIRDADGALSDERVLPYHFDIKKKVQDLECFLATRTVISKLNRSEKRKLAVYNNLHNDNLSYQEVIKIANFAIIKLRDLEKQFNTIWRRLESSFNLYYIGPKPRKKVECGVLLIRYSGSHITEVYTFANVDRDAQMEFKEYTEEDYAQIRDRLSVLTDDIFIVAESDTAFNTQHTAMPYLTMLLETKIF